MLSIDECADVQANIESQYGCQCVVQNFPCFVCGDRMQRIENRNNGVTDNEIDYNCGDLEDQGLNGAFDLEQCNGLTTDPVGQDIKDQCGCVVDPRK